MILSFFSSISMSCYYTAVIKQCRKRNYVNSKCKDIQDSIKSTKNVERLGRQT